MRIQQHHPGGYHHIQIRSHHKRDKKAPEEFIKGPFKLKLVLETVELNKHNCKYGDRCTKSKRLRKNSSDSSSEEEQVGRTKQMPRRKTTFTNKKKTSDRTCPFLRDLDTGPQLPGTQSPMQ